MIVRYKMREGLLSREIVLLVTKTITRLKITAMRAQVIMIKSTSSSRYLPRLMEMMKAMFTVTKMSSVLTITKQKMGKEIKQRSTWVVN